MLVTEYIKEDDMIKVSEFGTNNDWLFECAKEAQFFIDFYYCGRILLSAKGFTDPSLWYD